MQPLFPVPRAGDIQIDEWGDDGQERILDRAPLAGLHREARKHYLRSQGIAVDHLALEMPPEYRAHLEAYRELVVRAHVAFHLSRYQQRFEGAPKGWVFSAPAEYLHRYLLSRDTRMYPAVAGWFAFLIHDGPRARHELEAFKPTRYLEAMCALFGVLHPYAHEGKAGDIFARSEGLLP